MRDEHAVFAHQLQLLLRGMDAVRHDAGVVAAEEAEAVIGVAVKSGIRAKLAHPRDLAEVLGEVALHGQIVFFDQTAQTAQQLVRAGRDEAGREDGLGVCEALARCADPRLGIGERLLHGRLTQIVRAVAIHVDLADVGDKAAGLELFHQQGRGRDVQRGKETGAGGRAAAQMRYELAVGAVGIGQVGVFRFLGEGVGVEPVEQLHIHAQPAKGELRRVRVQVDQTGQDELVAHVEQRKGAVDLREDGKDARAETVFADQIGIFAKTQLVRTRAVTDVPLYDKIRVHKRTSLLHSFSPI